MPPLDRGSEIEEGRRARALQRLEWPRVQDPIVKLPTSVALMRQEKPISTEVVVLALNDQTQRCVAINHRAGRLEVELEPFQRT